MQSFTPRNIVLVLFFLFISFQSIGQTNDEKYQSTIELADQYFSDEDYLNAKASYQYASRLKPAEQYPKDKLKESMQLLRVQIDKKADYSSQVKLADELLANTSYDKAIEAYQGALEIFPDKQYPKDQIAECNARKAEDAANKQEYDKLIAQGDQAFSALDYHPARSYYEQAYALTPNDPYPQGKIDEINEILLLVADNQSAYDQAMSDAEESYRRKKYEDALNSFKIAAELKPEESLPQQKISELNSFLKKYEEYNALVTDGDNLYIAQDYEMAKIKYLAALKVLPDENYPRGMINKIDGVMEEKAIEAYANYDEWIVKADELFNEEDYASAMIAYQKALNFKPNEKYATEKIGAINEIINYRNSQEEAYKNSIARADKLLSEESFTEAKAEYVKASGIKPMEQYPMVKIDEIDVIITDIRNKEEVYDRTVAGADKLFNTGDYEKALVQYEKAVQIFPNKDYAPNQIIMINDILNRNKSLSEAYERAIAAGDRFLSEKEYDNAKTEYMSAIDIKPDEQYPKDKINEINELLAQLRAMEEAYNEALTEADQLFEQRDFDQALLAYRKAGEIKTDETYPGTRINEITALLAALQAADENYAAAISKADGLFNAADYTGAKTAYQEALAIKPEEIYPKDQVAAIDVKLAELAAAQELDDRYLGYVDNGDQFFTAQDYVNAQAEYQKASELKPEEQYPKDKLAEITGIYAALEKLQKDYNNAIITADQLFQEERYDEALAAYTRALGYRPEESYPQTKITEIQGIQQGIATQQAVEESYLEAVASADRYFSEEDYTAAKLNYAEASRLKPEEQYPKDKMAEIEAILSELARQQALEEEYGTIIAKADQYFTDKDYDNSKVQYESSLQLKPDDPHATARLAEIATLLAGIELAKAEELARQKALDDSYFSAIATADQFFNVQDYMNARPKYEEASEIKPEEQYPKQQIAEIDRIFAEERDRNYDLAINSGDEYFNAGNYLMAIQSFELALTIKPGESYPQRKISESEVFIMAEREAKMKEYKVAIADADKFFNQKIYDKAIDRYMVAFELLPNEAYPIDQVNAIKKIINDNAIVDINQEMVLIPDNTDKRFSFVPMPVSVRKENYILIKANNPVARDFKMLVSYGSGGAKNGGFAIRIPESDEPKEYIIRIGAQYKWFSEENNWLSIYPEGGDLEVFLIRISKSN